MRFSTVGAALFTFLVLSACGPKTGCYGLTDAEAVARIIKTYAALPAIDKAAAAQTQFSKARAVGIGRNTVAKDSGRAMTQVWFSQEDHTVTVATLAEDCTLAFRPGLTPDAIKDAVLPVKPAAF